MKPSVTFFFLFCCTIAIGMCACADAQTRYLKHPDGSLYVVGDSGDTSLVISTPNVKHTPGLIQIHETPSTGLASIRNFDNVTDIYVDLGHGRNTLHFWPDSVFPGDVSVFGGQDSDEIGLGRSIVSGELFIYTGNGDNCVWIRRTTIEFDTTIYSGADDNDIEFSSAEFNGDFYFGTNGGHNDIDVFSAFFGRNATFVGGEGRDKIVSQDNPFSRAFHPDLEIAGDLNIETRGNNDQVKLANARLQRSVTIDTGTGRDTVELAPIWSLFGSPTTSVYESSVSIVMEPNDDVDFVYRPYVRGDELVLAHCIFERELSVYLGPTFSEVEIGRLYATILPNAGIDSVVIEGATSIVSHDKAVIDLQLKFALLRRHLSIEGGFDSSIFFDTCRFFDGFEALLGPGEDRLEIVRSTIFAPSIARGGSGYDTLVGILNMTNVTSDGFEELAK